MQTSFVIKQEYFALIKKLNQSNKHKNQHLFYIDSSHEDHLKLFAAIPGSQKILLCYKVKQSKWMESQFSQFSILEEFIAELLILYDGNKGVDLTKYIKSHIFKLTF